MAKKENNFYEQSMRRTSCPSVEISNRSDSGGDRQPTEKQLKRQNAPARKKTRAGAKE
jgi:hypothetical protein